jgi:hypothetical protein
METNDIISGINNLLIKVESCGQVKPKDFIQLINIVAMLAQSSGNGENYDRLIQEQYLDNPNDITVSYPVGHFHAISIAVMRGTINYGGFIFYEGTVRDIEFSTVNQIALEFIVKANSQVYVEYLMKRT